MATFCQQQAAVIVNQKLIHLHLQQKVASSKPRTYQLPFTTNYSSKTPPRSMKSSSYSFKCSMHALPNPTAVDLKLTVKRCSTVAPYQETERRTMFLSDLEQYLNFNLGTISFFTPDCEFSPETVADRLETAYKKALVHYDYLAGRLRFNTEQGRLEIDCNSAGAGFVVVSSELTMAELGDLVDSCPVFKQLETMRPEKCLFVIQVISFRCGGFAITTCMNHVTFDGWSLKMFMNNLTSILATDHLLFVPCNDRGPMSSSVHLPFPHLKGIDLDLTPKTPDSDVNTFQVKSLTPVSKVFRLTADHITRLKLEAMEGDVIDSADTAISRFKLITAHVWRCKGLARNPGNDPDKKSTVHFPVDIRSRLKHPPLPDSFTGNATIDSPWTTTCRKLEEGPFTDLVEMVSAAVSNITEEYIRSVIHSGNWLTGFPYGDVIVTPWMKLGFAEVEYPWGKSKCTCPLVLSDWDDIIIMFPDEENGHGANLLVTLPVEEMQKFEALFHKLM